jgi:glyoxalase superfamily protein
MGQNERMLRIGSIVMGVSDVRRAAAFWMQALDYHPRDEIEDTWVVLVPRTALEAGAETETETSTGTQLALGLSETPLQEHPRLHLDLYARDAADQAAEVERLISLGAQHVDWDLYPEDPDFIVLADPDGNRFCVIDTSHSS